MAQITRRTMEEEKTGEAAIAETVSAGGVIATATTVNTTAFFNYLTIIPLI
ncbi:hypothetical protein SLEP1_g45368 [Rubroshorea leprosula]|uniref:Uncharacterized protein n=1 Tax=Rubroshorea leprosula TaxID=152421 RepID=A0AAV5LKC4_9ROSI|nr:hypothetical protein SLEP1_g45368 [Rubroshorea leprosula]